MDEEEKLQRLALEKCNVVFAEKLNVSAILPQLIARHLLADDEKQMLIMPSTTNGQKAQYLLDIIPRKEKGWFEQFIECLRESTEGTGHRDLVKELETKFQELREQSVTENKKRDGKSKRLSVDRKSCAQLESQQPVGGQPGGGQADAREEVSNPAVCHGHNYTS